MNGITLDTGALIALERRKDRMRRGDVVYTSDVGDLTRLQRHFPGVRVLSV
jgi:hypothetical protein